MDPGGFGGSYIAASRALVQHPTYPCDSTLEQLYDATEFEAYHQLGAAAVLSAAGYGKPSPGPQPGPGIPVIVPVGPTPALPTAAITSRLQARATEARKTNVLLKVILKDRM